MGSNSGIELNQQFMQEGRKWWQEIVIVLLLVAPMVIHGNEFYLLLLPFILFVSDKDLWRTDVSGFKQNPFSASAIRYVWLPAFFIVLALGNKLLNSSIVCGKDYYASFMLLPVLLLCSKYIFTRRTVRVFIAFVLFQTVIGFVEYLLNTRSIFLPLTKETTILSKELLYDSRVFGFGVNSTGFALEVLLAFMFLLAASFKRQIYWIVFIVLFVGLLLSFGRAVVLMAVLYFVLTLLQLVLNHRKDLKNAIKKTMFIDFSISTIVVLAVFFSPWMQDNMNRGGKQENLDYNQFAYSWDTIPLTCAQQHAFPLLEPQQLDTTSPLTRNFLQFTKKINTSGRKLIWMNYVNILNRHLLTGNASNKLQFRAINPKTREVEIIHAHNSYLMLFGTHGLILGGFYIVLLFVWWKRRNFVPLLVILAYSFLQYGIFWGLSITDIVFMAFILSPFNFNQLELKRENS